MVLELAFEEWYCDASVSLSLPDVLGLWASMCSKSSEALSLLLRRDDSALVLSRSQEADSDTERLDRERASKLEDKSETTR